MGIAVGKAIDDIAGIEVDEKTVAGVGIVAGKAPGVEKIEVDEKTAAANEAIVAGARIVADARNSAHDEKSVVVGRIFAAGQ